MRILSKKLATVEKKEYLSPAKGGIEPLGYHTATDLKSESYSNLIALQKSSSFIYTLLLTNFLPIGAISQFLTNQHLSPGL